MIREMTIRDYDELLQLWLQEEGMGLRSLDDSEEGIAAFLTRNPGSSFVAVEDGKIVGSVLGGTDGRRGCLYHTVVHPDYRHRGIAAALIDRAVSVLQAEGVTRVCLQVRDTNRQGKTFWEHLGWSEQEFLCFYSKSVTERENGPLRKKCEGNG